MNSFPTNNGSRGKAKVVLRLFFVMSDFEGPVAQWIRHRSTEPEIVGSSPTRVSIFVTALLCWE